MKEQFATFEIALAVKELGFDEPCLAHWYDLFGNSKTLYIDERFANGQDQVHPNHEVLCLAPLWQQLIDWLREKYKFQISVEYCGDTYPTVDKDYDVYYYKIWEYDNGFIVDTYEEAREQAILKAIKVVK